MPWSNQGGGGGPWGGGQGPRSGGGPGQPDLEEMLRRGQARFKSLMPGGLGSGRAIMLIAFAAIALWLVSGFYRVDPNELGVELVFNKMVGTTPPGLNYNWPAPIGKVETPKVTFERQVQVGFRRFTARSGRGESIRDVTQESLMLTGDENIIDVHVVVFWKIDTRVPEGATDNLQGVRNFLFNIRNPEKTVKDAAESALREIIGKTRFEVARTGGRVQIQTEAQVLIQKILDHYSAGIEVTRVKLQKVEPPSKVIAAFKDVQAASADRERKVNEALAYRNEVREKARGEAQSIINAALGYKAEKVAIATGEASRFLAVYKEYVKDKEVTKRRIYLQTMREVLAGMDKILIDNRGGGSGVVPYLPLDQLTRPRRAQGAEGGAQ